MRLEIRSRTKGRERPQLKRTATRGFAAIAIAGILLAPTAGCTNAENNNNTNYKPTSPSIVLIDFYNSLSMDQETNMGNEITTLVSQATRGVITPTLTFTDSTTEAQDFFEQLAGMTADPTCTNDLLPASFASGAADTTMDLKNYDTVIALSPKPFCEEGVAGATDRENVRYIDVALQPTGDIGNTTPGRTAAHEIMHTFGWGHEGELRTEGQFLGLTNDLTFDLVSYLSSARYFEYGDTKNLMGFFARDGQPGDAPQPDPVQMDQLREDIGDPSREGVVANQEWQEINQTDPNHNPYAIVNLTEPLSIGTSLEDPNPTIYDKIVLIPHWTENGIDSILVSLVES
ncbi:MAG TPA: hypothetical protein VLF20_03860, partial [Patescibacteria group bacterium]|nr:hypothetical protein [Patescibacteria group bacterium]